MARNSKKTQNEAEIKDTQALAPEVAPVETETPAVTETIPANISKDRVKEITRRYPSMAQRGEDGKVIRQGRNLSGNAPFNRKYYYLNPTVANRANWTVDYVEAFSSAPKQVRAMMNYMAEGQITSANTSQIGKHICDGAKESGLLTSKIDSDKLFAYYRRAMEALGLIHATEIFDGEEAADETADETAEETADEETAGEE
jgi:Iap family predicted aminopeptidase